jgi:hypothetical protein
MKVILIEEECKYPEEPYVPKMVNSRTRCVARIQSQPALCLDFEYDLGDITGQCNIRS